MLANLSVHCLAELQRVVNAPDPGDGSSPLNLTGRSIRIYIIHLSGTWTEDQ